MHLLSERGIVVAHFHLFREKASRVFGLFERSFVVAET